MMLDVWHCQVVVVNATAPTHTTPGIVGFLGVGVQQAKQPAKTKAKNKQTDK